MSRLQDLQTHGQALWLDYIRRDLFEGKLERLIEEDGLRGMTSNPTIFEKAIGESDLYDDFIAEQAPRVRSAKALYEAIAVRDIQAAADVLHEVYERTKGRDGYVSIEANPDLAHDTEGTLAEVRRLWRVVGRENVMVKVPGTAEGLPAIEQLVSEGLNINVTLLFSQDVYEKVVDAYLGGLEKLAKDGGDVSKPASVASFFVSRVDVSVEKRLNERMEGASDARKSELHALFGKAAIANAKLAYARYQQRFAGERWEALAKKGAHTQRVLWASTSTKNPDYPDVFYPEALIGPDTVDTLPPETMDAFRDHGKVNETLTKGVEQARKDLAAVEAAGISLTEVTDALTEDGVRRFSDDFHKLLDVVERERKAATKERRPEA